MVGRNHLASLLLPVLLGACGVDLEHGLDERQANQIASLLESKGISADKLRDDATTEETGWKITVPRGDLGRAFTLLEQNDLPRRDRHIEADHGLLPSLGEEQARLETARAGELEQTLERIPGVVSARVHLALVDSSRLDSVTQPPRASVLLRTAGALPVEELAMRRLVAGAVSGMSVEAVTLVVANADATPNAALLEPVGPLRVARGERGRVVAIAASGLALIVALGTALLLAALRLQRRDHSPSKRNG